MKVEESEEAKRSMRMSELAAEEVKYLRDSGWVPVMMGPTNLIRYKDPRGGLFRLSDAVLLQKDRDGFHQIFDI